MEQDAATSTSLTPFPMWTHWMSPSIARLAPALVNAQKQYPVILKDKVAKVRSERTGKEFEYHYADLPQILEKIRPILTANGLSFHQRTVDRGGKIYITSMLIHDSGEWLCSDGIPVSTTLERQKLGGDLTYCRRYDGCALLGIASEEDTDIQVLPNRKRPSKGEQDNQTSAPSQPVMTGELKERAALNDRFRKYVDIVGVGPMKKFVDKVAGVKTIKDLPKNRYEEILQTLDVTLSTAGETGLLLLVNGD